MNWYSYNKKLKQKILNYFLINGKKQNCENTLLKVIKHIQKSNKQSHIEILKLSILNTTPIFRIIKLKEKKRKKKKRKKNIKEIPTFVSNKIFRSSWALKFIVTTTKTKTKKATFYNRLKNEILLNTKIDNNAVGFKNELQKQALQKKIFFKYYRW